MKISSKVLSLPPYLSTSWKNVALLHIEQKNGYSTLIVTLQNGSLVEVPGLDIPTLEAVFKAHAEFLEEEPGSTSPKFSFKMGPYPFTPPAAADSSIGFNIPLPFGLGGIENFGSLLQHNVDQANAPDLPSDVLNKIAEIARSVAAEDLDSLPKAEPHCNCVHCQLARAMHGETKTSESIPEEIVSEEDLTFRGWDIKQTSDKLYVVTNPLEEKEQFHVFLGTPIGCTCGEKNCEHVRAVLNS